VAPVIRTAQLQDVEPVLRLWTASAATPTPTDDADSLRGLIRHDPSALLVAEESGEIVGSVIAAWDGWRGSIYRLVVAPSHRRLGLGRRLVREAETQLTEKSAVRLHAIAIRSDSGAMKFWRGSDWELQTGAARFVKG
jgi:ribosomal protein S18 acetylase RimI-like enzyme